MEGVETTEVIMPSVEEIKKWKRNDVTIFLNKMKESLDLDAEDIKKITDQKVAGQDFLLLTEEKLLKYGLKGGPATRIAQLVIKEIKGEEQGN
jgi:hypothetical protein